jgi:hypothetical protein
MMMGKTDKGRDMAPYAKGSPVNSVGPTADFYIERADQIALACAKAMRAGDIHLANELYERGVNAVANHLWHRRLALCVGSDFTLMRS